MRTYLEKPFTKVGLVEWLKVKALSSSPSTAKKKKKKLYMAAHTCHLSYRGSLGRRIVVHAGLGINSKTLFEK
jgi:hypothetical protein